MVALDGSHNSKLIAHLLRRAGFGATPDELDWALERGYDATLEELLNPSNPDVLPDDLIRRYHVDQSDLRGSAGVHWIYRMVKTGSPLREKMCLLWHRVFATGATKLGQTRVISNQIDMFREHGTGSFRDLLVRVSRDPAMLMWLDNQDNHKDSINENYGREILELFSMGIGNYTEDDIKECARAFTGWRIVNPEYNSVKMRNNAVWPHGYISWQFEYDDDDHDHGQKTLLGETSDFNGEDAVDIICKQEATARFISRHLYHFFVADEHPVPQWPHTSPRDPAAIDTITKAYFDSGYSIKEMLRATFNSDFFKSEASQFARTKSPAEMIVGTMRLAGGLEPRSDDTYAAAATCANMGQALAAPLSVDGWQGGSEWINTGTYVGRVNFAGRILDDANKPGLREIINRVKQFAKGSVLSPEVLVDSCLKVLGFLEVLESTRSNLVAYAGKYGDLSLSDSQRVDQTIITLIQMIVSTQEYQMV